MRKHPRNLYSCLIRGANLTMGEAATVARDPQNRITNLVSGRVALYPVNMAEVKELMCYSRYYENQLADKMALGLTDVVIPTTDAEAKHYHGIPYAGVVQALIGRASRSLSEDSLRAIIAFNHRKDEGV